MRRQDVTTCVEWTDAAVRSSLSEEDQDSFLHSLVKLMLKLNSFGGKKDKLTRNVVKMHLFKESCVSFETKLTKL